MMESAQKCVLCGHVAEIECPWEVTWSGQCALSVHELLNLDLFDLSFFETASYCAKCKELIRDVHFIATRMTIMQKRLDGARQKIAQMLLTNVNSWVVDICPKGQERSNSIPPESTNKLSQDLPMYSNDIDDNEGIISITKQEIEMTDDEAEESIAQTEVFTSPPETFETPLKLCEFPPMKFDDPLEDVQHPPEEPPIDLSLEECNPLIDGAIVLIAPQPQPAETTSESVTNVIVCTFPGCKVQFRSTYKLEQHITNTHPGWKPFKCSVYECEWSSSRKHHITRHVERFHRVAAKISSSKVATKLTRHPENETQKIKEIMERVRQEVENEALRCDFPECGELFSTQYLLDSHKPTHPGWRAFKCPVESCTRDFIRRQHMRAHVQSAHYAIHNSDKEADPEDSSAHDSTPIETNCIPADTTLPPAAVNGDLAPPAHQSCATRKSTRLCALPKKLPLPVEGDSESENEDSDFEASEASSTSADEVEEIDAPNIPFKRRKMHPRENPKLGQTLVSTLGTAVGNYSNFTKLTEKLAQLCYSRPGQICFEVQRSVCLDGNLPTWEKLFTENLAEGKDLPSESFESTFCYLWKIDQIEAEKNFAYACGFGDCHRRLHTTDAWANHREIMHGEFLDRFSCPFCENRNFGQSTRLDSHIAKAHVGDSHPYACPMPLCESRYHYENQLAKHMTNQHPEQKFETKKEKRFYKNRVANINSKGLPTRVIFCKEEGCTYRTSYPKYMKSHMINTHKVGTDELPYTCDICGRGFSKRGTYRNHRRFDHMAPNELRKCGFCPKHFKTRHLLNDHIRFRHSSDAEKFSCKLCNRIYYTAESCESHEALHENKGWACVLSTCCQGPFDTREALVEHVKGTHDAVKELVCHLCGLKKTGKNAETNMQSHMRSHSREKTHKCRFCEKTFRQTSAVVYHEQTKHADQESVKSDYKCGECGEKFTVYLYYYRHCRNKHGNPMPKFQRKK